MSTEPKNNNSERLRERYQIVIDLLSDSLRDADQEIARLSKELEWYRTNDATRLVREFQSKRTA